ncbi:MAG: hypothetical protein GEU80_16285 [Dehalococcoidia bacterium]|nr:hypothetical protein [Dehalococcoidia bacterium]
MVPPNDPAHREYLEEAAHGRLSVQRCGNCRHLRYPVRTACPECRSFEYEWQPLTGKGTVYSYYVVPHPINPAFREVVPYVVALIELDEARDTPQPGRALRVVANIVREDGQSENADRVAIGQRVDVTFVHLGDGWALPQFRLSDESPEHETWQIPTRGPAPA